MADKNPYCSRKYPVLSEAWAFSRDTLQEIENAMLGIGQCDGTCVAVAGSFGRLEASVLSDIDYIIISGDKHEYEKVQKSLTDIARDKNLRLPNPNGVFHRQISPSELINLAGAKDENLDCLAQRILLLLESKSVYNKQRYEKTLLDILNRYLELLLDDPNKFPVYLLNDIIRYFRWICVNYEFSFWRENERWTLRNIKLRHSRIIMYAGMLLVLLNSGNKPDKRAYIIESLPLTPLERIVHVFEDNGCSYDGILQAYDFFLSKLKDADVRNALQVDYPNRSENDFYGELKSNSDKLLKELSNFVYGQRGKWSDEAFEYLIF